MDRFPNSMLPTSDKNFLGEILPVLSPTHGDRNILQKKGNTMNIKAAVYRDPTQPLRIEEIEIDAPAPNEVLVRTVASGVCHSDLHAMHGILPTRPPAVLGHEPAGIIEAVGSNVTSVKPGDHVIACTSIYCGQCAQCLQGR